jgi:hypothetical protein
MASGVQTRSEQKPLIIDIDIVLAIVSAPYDPISEYMTSLRNLNDNDISKRHEKNKFITYPGCVQDRMYTDHASRDHPWDNVRMGDVHIRSRGRSACGPCPPEVTLRSSERGHRPSAVHS